MADNTKRRKFLDEQIEGTTVAPKAAPKDDRLAKAEARFRRGRQRASDSRIQGNLELAKLAAKDLLQGTISINRLKNAQSTDSNN